MHPSPWGPGRPAHGSDAPEKVGIPRKTSGSGVHKGTLKSLSGSGLPLAHWLLDTTQPLQLGSEKPSMAGGCWASRLRPHPGIRPAWLLMFS